MVVEEKDQRLGQVIANLCGDLEDLQERMTPFMPTEKIAFCKGSIEDTMKQLEERKKETKLIIDAAVHFWGGVV